MKPQAPGSNLRHWIALGLAALSTAEILWVVTLFGRWQGSPSLETLWPLPGIYLLEIAALAVASWFGIAFTSPSRAPWLPALPWAAGGALLGFVVLGAWTIGLPLLPGAAGLLAGAWLARIDPRGRPAGRFVLLLSAALVQAAVILAVAAIGG